MFYCKYRTLFLRLIFFWLWIFYQNYFVLKCPFISLFNENPCLSYLITVVFIIFAVLTRTILWVTVNSHCKTVTVLLHALWLRALAGNALVWQLFPEDDLVHLLLQSFFFSNRFLSFASHFHRILFENSLFSFMFFLSFILRVFGFLTFLLIILYLLIFFKLRLNWIWFLFYVRETAILK